MPRLSRPSVDITLAPEPLANGRVVTQPRSLRVYTSSQPGTLSVVVLSPADLPRGLRLTREQVVTLRETLDAFLAEAPS